jgi:hypothetical protein
MLQCFAYALPAESRTLGRMRRSRQRHRPLEERAIRTRMLRDVALATGKTCTACGAEAVTPVGHRRIRRRICVRCGRKRGLTRHHDWSTGEPGRPPRPIVLCRKCHDAVEREQAVRVMRSSSFDMSPGAVDRIDRFT